jgi:Electron transfer DM13
MKSRRFVLVASLSFTVSLLGCTRDTVTQQSGSNAVSESPKFNDPVANSPSPQTAQSSQLSVLRSGEFVDGEHPTQGTVRIVEQNNQRLLELDQTFTTSTSGPDLVVILHRLADVIGSTTPPAFPIKEGDYVLLAPLKSYSGAQSYLIPASLNLDEFKSAAIWCRRFNATFGAATLKP